MKAKECLSEAKTKKRLKDIIKWLAIILLFVYAASYVRFSTAGRYVVSNHGGRDWRKEWCPQHLVYEYEAMSGRIRIAYTYLGAVYLPCILLDRWVWHPTMQSEIGLD